VAIIEAADAGRTYEERCHCLNVIDLNCQLTIILLRKRVGCIILLCGFFCPVLAQDIIVPDMREERFTTEAYRKMADWPATRQTADSLLHYGNFSANFFHISTDSFFSRALRVGHILNNDSVKLEALTGLGYTRYYKGYANEALALLLEAKSLAKKKNDIETELNILNGIGLVFIELSLYDTAISIFKTCYTYGKAVGKPAIWQSAILNTGWCYQNMGEYRKGIQAMGELARGFDTLSLLAVVVQGAANLGECYLKIGSADSAIFWSKQAFTYGGFNKDYESMYFAALNLAQAYLLKKETARAINYFNSVDTGYIQRKKNLSLLMNFYYTRYQLATAQKEVSASLPAYQQYIHWRDSLNEQRNTRQATYLIENHKREKLVLENRQLQLSNIATRQRNQFIIIVFSAGILILAAVAWLFYRFNMQRRENEKKALNNAIREAQLTALRSQMNPHFLFNLMGTIEEQIDTEPQLAQEMVNAFARLLRTSLEMSETGFISLHDEIQYLDNYCRLMQLKAGTPFTYSINQPPDADAHALFIPSMLVQPLIENAILHGFRNSRQTGIVSIVFSARTTNTITCTITDNGGGVTVSLRKSSTSYGQTILRKRLHLYGLLLNATLSLDAQNRCTTDGRIEGFTVTLVLPCLNHSHMFMNQLSAHA
jgi:tetratricopeptide (TPR) repeat protein